MKVFCFILNYSEKITYTLLLTVYYPLWIFLTLTLKLKIVLLKIKQLFICHEGSKIGYFGKIIKVKIRIYLNN